MSLYCRFESAADCVVDLLLVSRLLCKNVTAFWSSRTQCTILSFCRSIRFCHLIIEGMGSWLLLPQAEEVIAARISCGRLLQGRHCRANLDRIQYRWEMMVSYQIGDVANLTDIDGIDCDVYNKDLVAYYRHCDE